MHPGEEKTNEKGEEEKDGGKMEEVSLVYNQGRPKRKLEAGKPLMHELLKSQRNGKFV